MLLLGGDCGDRHLDNQFKLSLTGSLIRNMSSVLPHFLKMTADANM